MLTLSRYSFLRFFLALLLIVFLPAIILWHNTEIWKTHYISLAIAFFSFTATSFTLTKIQNFPGGKNSISILSTILIYYGLSLSLLLLFRLSYSNSYLSLTFLFSIFYFYSDFFIHERYHPLNLILLPFGKFEEIQTISMVTWHILEKPILPASYPQIIVADLHSPQLSSKWQKFLSDCTLKGIPVYNIRQVRESLSGRIKIQHMYENDLGSLLPSKTYMFFKQIFDNFLITTTLPITLPIMILTALFIKLEDGGKIFYSQKRVGLSGKDFIMYKFRSMKVSNNPIAQMTSEKDNRITKTGKIIRKLRIDELPQFLNILKGEMSLIGPRPEQRTFVKEFEKEIPFYMYRHVVKPGISGWAQVMHGYASNEAETRIKIEHDFYYIKNYSASLDILIFFKTLKTMITGFGAK